MSCILDGAEDPQGGPWRFEKGGGLCPSPPPIRVLTSRSSPAGYARSPASPRRLLKNSCMCPSIPSIRAPCRAFWSRARCSSVWRCWDPRGASLCHQAAAGPADAAAGLHRRGPRDVGDGRQCVWQRSALAPVVGGSATGLCAGRLGPGIRPSGRATTPGQNDRGRPAGCGRWPCCPWCGRGPWPSRKPAYDHLNPDAHQTGIRQRASHRVEQDRQFGFIAPLMATTASVMTGVASHAGREDETA
jgi:hypothetical protein